MHDTPCLPHADNTHTAGEIANAIRSLIPDGGIICLGGLGAAGKSTFGKALADAFDGDGGFYEGDGFQLQDTVRRNMPPDEYGHTPTGCHPDAYDADLASETLQAIQHRRTVLRYSERGVTCRKDDLPTSVGAYEPRKWTVLAGLSSLHLHFKYQFLFDSTIFMDCSLEEEKRRRFSRDRLRGKSLDDIHATFAVRRSQYERYILPYRGKCAFCIRSLDDYSVVIVD